MHQDSGGVVCTDTTNHASAHVTISSTLRGAEVAISLGVNAESALDGGDKITVDFSGPSENNSFILPRSITNPTTNRRVQINSDIYPTIRVTGKQVILTLPASAEVSGAYTITFEKSASIRNPIFAGASEITVLSDGEQSNQIDRMEVAISRDTSLSVSPSEGQRGDSFTLEGKGYPKGTVTIFDRDPSEANAERLDTVATSNGEFSKTLTARKRLGTNEYTVWTKDSEGELKEAPPFRITRVTTSIEPERVVVGSTVRIIIQDWQDDQQDIVGVSIGGEYSFPKEAIEYSNCIEFIGRVISTAERVLTLEGTLPAGTLLGEQTISVYDYDQLDLTPPDVSTKQPCTDVQEKGARLREVTATLLDTATQHSKRPSRLSRNCPR